MDYLIKTLGIRTIIDLRSGEESAGDIGDRLIYHYFVDEDATSKIVRRSKSELGDVFVSDKTCHAKLLTGSPVLTALMAFVVFL